jgi:hypothetical protein
MIGHAEDEKYIQNSVRREDAIWGHIKAVNLSQNILSTPSVFISLTF